MLGVAIAIVPEVELTPLICENKFPFTKRVKKKITKNLKKLYITTLCIVNYSIKINKGLFQVEYNEKMSGYTVE